MGMLDKNTVAECKALFPSGEVKAIDAINRTMDVQIGAVLHEDVPVHYHCRDDWETHTHPHTSEEQQQMLAAFKVGDQVLVMCDDDRKPLYVTGFLENPKSCSPIIALFKLIGETYDWWFYDLNAEEGYHQNPGVPSPATPEIITKGWSCEDEEEVEFYTRVTPAFQPIGGGGCADACGLINFNDGACCGELQGAGDESDAWYLCPCGGVGKEIGIPPYRVCWEMILCNGGCSPGEQEAQYPAAYNIQSRASNQSQNCPLGYSWGLGIGDLVEKIEIGPRNRMYGTETKSIQTVENAKCGPYESQWIHCDNLNWEGCSCYGSMSYIGPDCDGSFECTGWLFDTQNKELITAFSMGSAYQGCVDFLAADKMAAGYSTEAAPVITRAKVGAKETLFSGSWSQYISNEGNEQEGQFRRGTTTTCLNCDGSGDGWGPYSLKASYSYSESSYGVGGWRTIVTSDGRFAVLIPLLTLAAAVEQDEGNATGTITSSTEALLRIVEADEEEFGFGGEESNYALISMPTSRDDLGIKPNCYPRDLPLDIDLRAFHWHETSNFILAAFVMGGVYKAGIAKKIDNAWQLDELAGFKAWVAMNELEGHTAFLS